MMKKITSIFTVLFLLVGAAYAQQTGKVFGKVLDASTKEGLPFAVVVAYQGGIPKGSTESDFSGNYSLSGLNPGKFIITMGDAHCYLNHIENALIQIEREPYPFPTLDILKDINSIENIEHMEFSDFQLNNYKCHSGLKYEMAI